MLKAGTRRCHDCARRTEVVARQTTTKFIFRNFPVTTVNPDFVGLDPNILQCGGRAPRQTGRTY